MRLAATIVVALLAGCVSSAPPPPAPSDMFYSNLRALCGQRFAGRLETNEPADAAFAGKPLLMGPVDCRAPNVTRIPFAVGDDRSRTWVVTRVAYGQLRLKHDHRHSDGSEDALSQYGGDTVAPGAATRQEFPADDFSRELFTRRNLPRSLGNVWALELRPGETFAYELNRRDRRFRVAFDTSAPR